MKNRAKVSLAVFLLFLAAAVILFSWQVKPSGKAPHASGCNKDLICEPGEYRYSSSPDAQPCSDCLPKSYASLDISENQLQIIGANSNLGRVFQFKWADSDGDSVADRYLDTWGNSAISAPTLYPEIGDIDGDGHKEIIVVAEYSHTVGKGKNATTYYDYRVFVYKNGGQLWFESPAAFGSSVHRVMFGEVSTGDVDSDGIDELILLKIWTVDIYKYNTAARDFELKWTYSAGPGQAFAWAYGVSVGNADNDPAGTNELVLGTVDQGRAYVFNFQGEDSQGKFRFSGPIATESAGSSYIDIAKVRDVDNDGLNEIIGCGNNGCLMVWKYENGTYPMSFISSVPLGTYTEEIDSGDVDGLGSPGEPDNEVVIWGSGVNTIYVLKYFDPNPSDGLYGSFEIIDQVVFKDGLHELSVGDLDNDGKAEIIFGGASDSVYVYKLVSGHLQCVFQCVYGSPGGPRIK
jgi:hypothetical protein